MKKSKHLILKDTLKIIRHPWVIIFTTLILTVFFFFFMATKTEMDNDMSRFLPKNSKPRIRYIESSYTFGSGSGIGISLTGENVFSRRMVEVVNKITKNIKKLNNVVLKDIIKQKTKIKGKNFKIVFNLLLSQMGRDNFNLENLTKLLTDKKYLASTLGVSIQSGTQGSTVDPDDVEDGNSSSTQPSGNQQSDPDDVDDTSTSNQSQPSTTQQADPDDVEEQEENAVSENDVNAIIQHFKTNKKEIAKLYKACTIPTDQWKKRIYRSTWIDDVTSFADSDYSITQIVDKTKFYKLFKNVKKTDVDMFLAFLLEFNYNTKAKIQKIFSDLEDYSFKSGVSKEGLFLMKKKFPYKKFLKLLTDRDNQQLRSEKLIRIRDGQPITDADLVLLKNRIINWKFFKGGLISYDNKSTMILVKYIPNIVNKEMSRTYKYITKIVADAVKGTKIKYYVAGEPVVSFLLSAGMGEDLTNLIPFVLLLVIIFLYISFRHIKAVILPILTVIFSTIWAIGAMALMGIPLSVLSTTIPTLLIAVGTAYGIHIINDYYLAIEKGEDKLEAVKDTLRKVGLAVFLAGLTTIAGFASNGINRIVPIREFGLATALGVLFALAISMLFIPALLRVGKLPKKLTKDGRTNTHESASHKFLEALGRSTYKHKWVYVGIFLIVLVVSLIGLSKVKADMDTLKYFKHDTQIRVSDRYMNRHFGGTTTLEVNFYVKEQIIKQKKALMDKAVKAYNAAKSAYERDNSADNETAMKVALQKMKVAQKVYNSYKVGIIRPEFLKFMENIQGYIQSGSYNGQNYVGKTISIVDILKKNNQVFFMGDKKFHKLPKDVETANFYMTTFHSDTTEDYITRTNRRTRLIIQLKESSNLVSKRVMDAVNKYIKSKINLNEYGYHFTGYADMKMSVNGIVIDGQISSIIFSLIAVFLIILIAYKTFVGGIISIIPLALTILSNFAVMGFFKIALDASTALVASIAIGIGVDYTIHYINTFRTEAKSTSDLEKITEHTTSHSGRAILINAIVVGMGFLVLIFSKFNSVMYMGILVAVTMFVAGISSITVIPALINIIKPKSLINPKNLDLESEIKINGD